MQTHFSEAQLSDPKIREADGILRACVHCGFCTATCPTFVLLGDERDSPRGRIYLIKDMLEKDRAATAEDVLHIDRCLSCLACMTTCPSGVHYMHLVDHARAHLAQTYRRPLGDRLIRTLLAAVLPYPRRFRFALTGARLMAPLARRLRGQSETVAAAPAGRSARAAENRPLKGGVGLPAAVNAQRSTAPAAGLFDRMLAMLSLAPKRLPAAVSARRPRIVPADGERRGRVALLTGCAQSVLAPEINEAAIRVLTRAGVEVVLAKGEGCCGALVHHMGREDDAHAAAMANIDAWWAEHERDPLDAILVTASGCGTQVKDYGHMLRTDPTHAEKAAEVSGLARDITQYVVSLERPEPVRKTGASLAYHSACSMQHGQKITREPKALLSAAGFSVRDIPEGHLCCGSAGTYNIMQPGIAEQLKTRKLANIDLTGAEIVATGNIGCLTQLSAGPRPVVHTIELLDWAEGGPAPAAAEHLLAEDASADGPTRVPQV